MTAARTQASCDYCRAGIGCTPGEEAGYWRLEHGVTACDACLLQHSDEYAGRADRLLALRLRHVRGIDLEGIEAICTRADGVIVAWQVKQVREGIKYARHLLSAGRRDAAMEAGQAAWNLALGLFNALESKREVQAGRALRTGGAKGADQSKITRRGKDSKRARILSENASYAGSDDARVRTIARRAGSTERYVRTVLKNPEP